MQIEVNSIKMFDDTINANKSKQPIQYISIVDLEC